MAYQYQRKLQAAPSEIMPLTMNQWFAYAFDSGRICSRDEALAYFRELAESKKK